MVGFYCCGIATRRSKIRLRGGVKRGKEEQEKVSKGGGVERGKYALRLDIWYVGSLSPLLRGNLDPPLVRSNQDRLAFDCRATPSPKLYLSVPAHDSDASRWRETSWKPRHR